MLEFLGGLLLAGVWIVLQFVRHSTSGYIHLLLAAAVLLIIRGISVSRWANREPD